MKGRSHQQPGLAGRRLTRTLGKDGILERVARLVFEDHALAGHAQCSSRRGAVAPIPLPFQHQRAGASGHNNFACGIAPGKDSRPDIAVAAAIEFIAAARQIDRCLRTPPPRMTMPVDVVRRGIRPDVALFERRQASWRRGRSRPIAAGSGMAPAAMVAGQPAPADIASEQRQREKQDRQVERLQEEPDDFGCWEEQAGRSGCRTLPTTARARNATRALCC